MLAQNNVKFDIRSHLDALTPTKQKNRYICPTCGKDNLTVNSNTGAYKCWTGCPTEGIRNAIAPLQGKSSGSALPPKSAASKKKAPQPDLPKGTLKVLQLKVIQ